MGRVEHLTHCLTTVMHGESTRGPATIPVTWSVIGDDSMPAFPGLHLVAINPVVSEDRRRQDDRLALMSYLPCITNSECAGTDRDLPGRGEQ